MKRPLSFKMIVLLALLQGALGLLRAYDWMRIGTDLFAQGLLMLPALGAVAFLRGMFISVVAGLYLLFVCGALLGARWAWPVCFTAAVINMILVVNALLREVPLHRAIAWAIIPALLLIYLVSPAARAGLGSAAGPEQRRR